MFFYIILYVIEKINNNYIVFNTDITYYLNVILGYFVLVLIEYTDIIFLGPSRIGILNYGRQFKKFEISRSPVPWLFSG